MNIGAFGMLVAHMADIHLGKMLYRLDFTREQIIRHFEDAVENIIRDHFDAVIISGDIFDEVKPHNFVLKRAIEAVKKLREKEIEVFIVNGDHDTPKTRGEISPIYLLPDVKTPKSDPGYSVYSVRKNGLYDFVLVYHHPLRAHSELKKMLVGKIQEALNHTSGAPVLVMHQNIKNFFGFEEGVEIDEIPSKYVYVAMGHLHRRIVYRRGDKQIIAYPGSLDFTTIADKDEYEDFKRNGKGYYIVDLSKPSDPQIQMINIETTPIEQVEIDFEKDLEETKFKPAEAILRERVSKAIGHLRGRVRENNRGILHVSIRVSPFEEINTKFFSDSITSLVQKLLGEYSKYLEIKIEVERKSTQASVLPPIGEEHSGISEREVLMELLMSKMKELSKEEALKLAEQIRDLVDAVEENEKETINAVLDELVKHGCWRIIFKNWDPVKLEKPNSISSTHPPGTSPRANVLMNATRKRGLDAWVKKSEP